MPNSTQYWKRQITPSFRLGIVCIQVLIIIVLYSYNYHIQPKYGNVDSRLPDIEILSHRQQCYIPYDKCEYDRFVSWDICRVLLFSIIGMYMPDKYISALMYSTVLNGMKYAGKGQVRFVSTTTANMLGYSIGSNIRQLSFPVNHNNPKF